MDLVATHQPPATPSDLFFHHIIVVLTAEGDFVLVIVFTGGLSPAARFGVVILFIGFFAHQRFTVGHRDLIIVRVNFVEGQESVAIAAILDECRLERRLHPGHFGEIDISPQLFAVLTLEIEFFNPCSVDHHHTRFFGVSGVDKHLL